MPRRVIAALGVVGLPTALLLVLGGVSIGRRSLTRDEAATWAFSRLSFVDLVHATRHVDAAFLPYYALIRLTPGATAHPLLMRGWSLLAAAVTVAVVAATAARLWSRWAGVLAGLVLASNGAFVEFAVTARPGALAAMFCAITTYLLVRARQSGAGPVLWAGYSASAVLLLWTSLFGGLVLAVHVLLALLWWFRDRAMLLRFAGALGVAAVLVAPVALSARGQRAQLSWIHTRSVAGAVQLTQTQLGQPHWHRAALTLLAVLVAVSGAVVLRRGVAGLLLGPLLVVVPGVGLWIMSQAVQPVEIGRYAVVVPEGGALTLAAAAWVVVEVGRRLVHAPAAAGLLAGATALAVLVATLVVQGHALDGQVDPGRSGGFPGQVRAVRSVLGPGTTVVLVQNYVASGVVAGFALYSHDAALLRDVESTLPHRTQLVFARRVVGVDPLRTVAVDRLTGRVLVVGLSPPRRDRHLYWYADLVAAGCRPTSGRPGRQLRLWQCPAAPRGVNGRAVPTA